jgi:predicted O-linked N-acetylglucosamine transferase (SPINDLY family)
MRFEDHLARHSLANLFLDTLPCTAHTTASDALWMGLPVLTAIGSTFAGRVAASLLSAAGVPELAVSSIEAYESAALDLARNPEKLAWLKSRLQANRYANALFDTARFTQDLEAAFTTMWGRTQRGEPPASFAVSRAE